MSEKVNSLFIVNETSEMEELSSFKEMNHFSKDCLNLDDALQKHFPNEHEIVIIYLSDELTRQFLEKFIDCKFKILILPHPDNKLTQNAFQIPATIPEVLNNYLTTLEEEKENDVSTESSFKKTSLIFVNNTLVIQNISSGSIMNLVASPVKGIRERLKSLRYFFKKVKAEKYYNISLTRSNGEDYTTTITDFLIVKEVSNSAISRALMDDVYTNNKMFHLFLMAPRSIFQVFSAFILKLFLGKNQKVKSFKFLGHIKDSELFISFDKHQKMLLDGQKKEFNELKLELKGKLNFYIHPNLNEQKEEESNKPSFKVGNLPTSEDKEELSNKNLPWLKHATTDEYRDLFGQLRNNAKPKQTYVVLMILSTILATFGLFSDSSPVIIGAMILAPLMSPIISLSMGVLRQDKNLIQSSFITVFIGIAVGYIFAFIITVITPLSEVNEQIQLRTNPNIIDLGIAVVSGAAGAYAHAKEEIAKTLAGVAIAVALVPPLAVSGIGLGWLNWEVFFGAFLLLITNLTGMVLAGSFTFLLAGYSPFKLAKKGLLISSFIVVAISVPLGYGFFRVVQENKIVETVSNKQFDNVELKNVRVVNHNPLTISLTVLSDEFPSQEKIKQVKEEVELILDRKVVLEIQTSLKM